MKAFSVIVKISGTLVLSSNIYSVLCQATASLFTPGAGWCGPGWKIAEIVGSWAAANTIIITMARLIWAAYRTQHSTTICTQEAANHPLDTRHRHSSFHRNNNSNNTAVVTPDTTSLSAPITLLLIIVQCSGVPQSPMSL